MTDIDPEKNSTGKGVPYHHVAWLVILWAAIIAWISPLAGLG